MPKFRKKPVVVEAELWSGSEESYLRIIDLCGAEKVRRVDTGVIAIETDEGTMQANPSDWIIRGVEGEVCPCRASVFDATYEEVKDAD